MSMEVKTVAEIARSLYDLILLHFLLWLLLLLLLLLILFVFFYNI